MGVALDITLVLLVIAVAGWTVIAREARTAVIAFIGLGLQPPYSSWGTLANEGFRAMKSYPHLILFPGSVLFVTLLAFNYVGDGLRDWLDPRGTQVLS